MSLEELEEARKFVLENLQKGLIEPSDAAFGAPVLFVPKGNGRGLRLCFDYRELNKICEGDEYPLPLIDGVLLRLAKAKRMTMLDIIRAFNRIRIASRQEDITTFRTPLSAYHLAQLEDLRLFKGLEIGY